MTIWRIGGKWKEVQLSSGLECQPEDGAILPRGLVKTRTPPGGPPRREREKIEEYWDGNTNLRKTTRDSVKGTF